MINMNGSSRQEPLKSFARLSGVMKKPGNARPCARSDGGGKMLRTISDGFKMIG